MNSLQNSILNLEALFSHWDELAERLGDDWPELEKKLLAALETLTTLDSEEEDLLIFLIDELFALGLNTPGVDGLFRQIINKQEAEVGTKGVFFSPFRGIDTPQESESLSIINMADFLSGIKQAIRRFTPPVTQSRRLEAAMPKVLPVNQPTELLVMIPLPGSLGLKSHLPITTEAGDLITQEDVVDQDVAIEFPNANQPITVYLFVQCLADFFDIADPFRPTRLYWDKDHAYETFLLKSRQVGKNIPITVVLYADEQKLQSLGTIRLHVDTLANGENSLSANSYSYAHEPVVVHNHYYTIAGDMVGNDKIDGDKVEGDKVSVGDVNDASVAIGRDVTANNS